jgi:agmatinase
MTNIIMGVSTKMGGFLSSKLNGVGQTNQGIFGLPHKVSEADVVVLGLPWDATTSFQTGTAFGPESILKASPQLDLYHPYYYGVCESGIAFDLLELHHQNQNARPHAVAVMDALAEGSPITPVLEASMHAVNVISDDVNQIVVKSIQRYVASGKFVVGLGGEHSVTYPYLHYISTQCENFGVLQIDAHMDLRPAYCGFSFSHASVMHQVMQLSGISRLVQVGVRDYCEYELTAMKESKGKIKSFFDRDINEQLFTGKTWDSICKKIINALPDRVFISIDCDGLMPSLCPNTGTPVPGGITYQQLSYLLEKLALSKKQIIGCDLVEVGGHPWDANVGARLLYQLCGWFWYANQG